MSIRANLILSNINNNERHPCILVSIGHSDPQPLKRCYEECFPPAVWLSFDFGVMSGGFYTRLKDADRLYEALGKVIAELRQQMATAEAEEIARGDLEEEKNE